MFTPNDLQQRKQDSVRVAICECARRLIADQGFEHTTVDEIARAAGMSRRTFFRYFSAKEDVVLWPLDQYGLAVAALIGEQPAGTSPLRAIEHALIKAAEFFNEQPEDTLRILRMADATPSLHNPNLAQQERWKQWSAEALRKHFKLRTDSVQAELLAGIAVETMRIAVRRWLEQPETSLTVTARARFRELRALLSRERSETDDEA